MRIHKWELQVSGVDENGVEFTRLATDEEIKAFVKYYSTRTIVAEVILC